MSYKFVIFDTIPDFIKEQIKEIIGDNLTQEYLEDLSDMLSCEIKDMNFQLKLRALQVKRGELEESEDYLEWKERLISRLRIKNSIYGVVVFNLRKLKTSVLEKRIEDMEILIKSFLERQDKYYEEIKKKLEGHKNEREKEHRHLKERVQKLHDESHRQRSFILRCLYHLLTIDGIKTDEESLYLAGCLSFIPPVMEKSPEFGKFPK